MAMLSTLVAFSLASAALPTLIDHDRVAVASRSIRLADVMPSAPVALGGRIVAVIPAGRDRARLSRVAIAWLARRALPGLQVGGALHDSVTFVLRPAAIRAGRPNQCNALSAPISAGSAIDRTLVMPVACSTARPAAVTFDRATSLPRARTDLAAGTYLGRIELRATGLRKGEATSLVSTVGPVRIVRAVTTLQASRGRRVFVRDDEGQVFSVRRAELAK